MALSICYRINCQLGVDCPLNIHWVYAASLKRPIFLHLCRIKLVKFILAFESWLIRFVGSPLLPTLTIHAGQTNHWVGSPSLKIQSSLRLGQPHPAFSMQTIINYLIVKYDQIIWGGKYCTQANMLLFIHASVWRYQNFRYQIFLVPLLIFFPELNLWFHPKKLEYFWKGGKWPSLSLCPFAMTVVFSSVPSSRGVGLGSTSLRLPCPSLINGRASDQSFFRGEGASQ